MQKDITTLRRAFEAWENASSLRQSRLRCKRFAYGDQWFDIIRTPDGRDMPERQYLIGSGKRPLTNNLIRTLIKTVIGRWRLMAKEQGIYEKTSAELVSLNQLSELDARLMEEYVISGCAIQRVVAERRPAGVGTWIDNINPNRFFVNKFEDPRGLDIEFVGVLHDMSWEEVVNRFGRDNSRRRLEGLKSILLSRDPAPMLFGSSDSLGTPQVAGPEFFTPAEGRIRVIETWSLERKATKARGRLTYEPQWICRWLSAEGYVLDSYISPFAHASHPFVVKLHPLTDGEVHSFVEDVIDQQKSINRLMVMIDTIMASSAKGALLYPIESLAPGMDIADVARAWAQPDSVIPVRSTGGMPLQVHSDPASSGAYQLLDLHRRFFEDTAGISDAMLGRNVSPAMGSAMYEAQVKNSTIALADLLESFLSFIQARNAKC